MHDPSQPWKGGRGGGVLIIYTVIITPIGLFLQIKYFQIFLVRVAAKLFSQNCSHEIFANSNIWFSHHITAKIKINITGNNSNVFVPTQKYFQFEKILPNIITISPLFSSSSVYSLYRSILYLVSKFFFCQHKFFLYVISQGGAWRFTLVLNHLTYFFLVFLVFLSVLWIQVHRIWIPIQNFGLV